ncbi:hypothetical protein T35B1_02235 [Salinisphaera shabanensis T35B1]|uniref:hypothetical protein n=1 Tax=Salinisphaera shabanensis TaxID=180542 RepID=UPI0033401E48
MSPELLSEYREYAWKYFALHADQRLKAFNFFVVFTTFLLGAFAALIARIGLQTYCALLPAALVYVAFVFWKLEERTRMLIKTGEEALRVIDAECLEGEEKRFAPLALFATDDINTKSLAAHPKWHGHFTYSRCFRWVYVAAAIAGLGAVGFCIVGA